MNSTDNTHRGFPASVPDGRSPERTVEEQLAFEGLMLERVTMLSRMTMKLATTLGFVALGALAVARAIS